MRSQWRWVAGVVALMLSACAEGPTGMAREARVVMSFLTPATVRTVVVEVSGPGLSPAVVLNIPVAADSTARDTLMLTAGAGRRFVVTALDSAGVTTHRADTTITLQAGANAPLAMRMEPLPSTLGITVTFGGARMTVSDTSTRVLTMGGTASVLASAVHPDGSPVPADSLQWASSNPAVAVVSSGGVVTAVRTGAAIVVVSYRGASARIPISVLAGGSSAALSTDGNPNTGTSGIIALGSFGKPQVFSVSFWFKPVITSERIFVLLDAQHATNINWVYQYLGAASGWCFNIACVPLASDTWHHILLTYDNGTVRYFVNGVLRLTQSYTINYTTTAPTLYLGNWFSGQRQFAGSVDDLYVTTDLQHTANFTPPVQVGTPSANLFGLWRFEEGSGAQTLSSAGAALPLGIWTWTTRAF